MVLFIKNEKMLLECLELKKSPDIALLVEA